jgi:gliding motility-associated-like protein
MRLKILLFIVLLCGILANVCAQPCADTSARRELKTDSIWLYSVSTTGTSDGNMLIAGWKQKKYGPIYNAFGLLSKCRPDGTIIWSKGGLATDTFSITFAKAFELADQTILVEGHRFVSRPINHRYDLVLLKLSANGDVIWQRDIGYGLWNRDSTDTQIHINDLLSLPSGEIYIAGSINISGALPRLAMVAKLSAADGSIIWSKGLPVAPFAVTRAIGINLVNNQLQVVAHKLPEMYAYALNPATGDTLFCRRWGIPDNYPNNQYRSFYPTGFTRLNNGNLVMYGGATANLLNPFPGPYRDFMTFELSPSLDFVRSYVINSSNRRINNISTMTVYADGSAAFSRPYYGTAYGPGMFFGKMVNGQIVKERVISSYGQKSHGDMSNFVRAGTGGDFVVQQLTENSAAYRFIETMLLHDSDISSDCLGLSINHGSVMQEVFVRLPMEFDTIRNNVLVQMSRPPYILASDNINAPFACTTISKCDSLKLIPSATVLCPSTPLRIIVKKNKECGSKPAWKYDTAGIKSFAYINDSTVEITFDSVWTGYIGASINGCTILRDSVLIRVLRTPPALELGADTTLCPGNTIVLNARSGYASYLWQDGSTDSTFTITQPGKYHVQVNDACGNVLRDTVNANPHPPIPFELGNDLTKCNNDTVQVTAPAGFINYSWSPAYNISSVNGQSVQLFPLVETIYKVRAEKSPGCFAYDSIKVTVNRSPKIYLGADTSLCAGQNIILDAGAAFASYAWSTGETARQITISSPAKYSVIATTAEGCRSFDTLQLLQVFALPRVSLNKDSALCMGAIKLLDAGSGFKDYTWSNGSKAQSITVNSTGKWWVTVTDNNSCTGSDTSSVTKLIPSPKDFLPVDTAICTYGDITLKPASAYSKYLWSNNSVTPAITIEKPGLYWLQVSDANNCTGRDSVLVAQKDCMSGFFVPNAFTPDNKRSNNTFRPLIFGNVVKYRFSIYNRWGQLVFDTTEQGRGWDGTVAGKPQDSNVFLWICTYQFSGQAVKIEKGSVVLVR